MKKLLVVILASTFIFMLGLLKAGCDKKSMISSPTPESAADEWLAFRHDSLRTGAQVEDAILSAPELVKKLDKQKIFQVQESPELGFSSSPIVYKNRVYVGHGNGRFYALKADNLELLWQYPPQGEKPLTSLYAEIKICEKDFGGPPFNQSSRGIAASATIANINGRDAVIFGAPDQSIGTGCGEQKLSGCGSGRLFALNAVTGAEIWKSPTIAHLNGLTVLNDNVSADCVNNRVPTDPGDIEQHTKFKELHEQIGFSSPLVYEGRVYIGIGDHRDNPIQQGRVAAVRLSDGQIDAAFSFCSTGVCGDGTRGGGIWSSVTGWGGSVYVTTGNTKLWEKADKPEPENNRGLSLLKLNKDTGDVIGQFQPVPYKLDNDPDWGASPTVMHTSCGDIVISTMKNGWTHALNTGSADQQMRLIWSFPPEEKIPFPENDKPEIHGDYAFDRSGAAWDDIYITMNGTLAVRDPYVIQWDSNPKFHLGYKFLYALNVCASEQDRVRWIMEFPDEKPAVDRLRRRALGLPTVSNGIIFIGGASGTLYAIADPLVYKSAGATSRCSHPFIDSKKLCEDMGYKFVPVPEVLRQISLDGSLVYAEPVLAGGRVYVTTLTGKLYMLAPTD